MAVKTASSTNPDAKAAAHEVGAALAGDGPKVVLFFASSKYDPGGVAAAMQETFPDASTFGCTTAGELVDARMLKGSLVAIALGDDTVEAFQVESVDDPSDGDSTRAALAKLSETFGPLASLDPVRHVGIVLHDGMRGTEETVMSALSGATNVPFVGGSAGDDGAFDKTFTFAAGQAKQGATVIALVRSRRPYAILKTQSFDVGDAVLTATDVDEASRTIRAFDGKPAAEAYAAALGIPVAELPQHFMTHPLGLVLSSGEPFVRSPQQVRGTDVVFYCSVKEGMQLSVLTARDIVEDTRRDLERALAQMDACSGIVNFHCILRTAELEAKGKCDAYGAVFEKHPTVGFSTYGESYIGHINQTSTMLLLG